MIKYDRVLLNIRGAGMLSAREIQLLSGVPEEKQYRMINGGAFKATDKDLIGLLDVHYDYCGHLHNQSIIDRKYLKSVKLRNEANNEQY